MSGTYWPWWLGALGLGGMTIGYYLTLGRTVGVSGAWERLLNWREIRAVEAADAAAADEDASPLRWRPPPSRPSVPPRT
jgi:hypothetical protein